MQSLNTIFEINLKCKKKKKKKKKISQQYDKTFLSMNDIIQFLLVLWAFLFSQSFQMYKNKDVLQKQKEKKKRNSPLPLSPVTTTTKTNR